MEQQQMTREQISELKREFIEQRQAFMKSEFSAAEKKLYDQVFTKVIQKLDSENGVVSANSKNLNISAEINTIYNKFNSAEYANIIRKFSSDLAKITTMNADYFNMVIDSRALKRFDSVKSEVKLFMGKRIGITAGNEVIKDSYIDRLIRDESLKNKIKDNIVKGITNKVPVEKLTKSLENLIVGNENVEGGLVRYFNQNMNDTYNQFDRTASMMFAEKLDLKFFIYQGGKIKTSRIFCQKHDGNCYTTKEAAKWKSEIGKKNSKGKPTGPIADKATYNPLVDCGGYNCRHSIDYISEGLARQLRPELFK